MRARAAPGPKCRSPTQLGRAVTAYEMAISGPETLRQAPKRRRPLGASMAKRPLRAGGARGSQPAEVRRHRTPADASSVLASYAPFSSSPPSSPPSSATGCRVRAESSSTPAFSSSVASHTDLIIGRYLAQGRPASCPTHGLGLQKGHTRDRFRRLVDRGVLALRPEAVAALRAPGRRTCCATRLMLTRPTVVANLHSNPLSRYVCLEKASLATEKSLPYSRRAPSPYKQSRFRGQLLGTSPREILAVLENLPPFGGFPAGVAFLWTQMLSHFLRVHGVVLPQRIDDSVARRPPRADAGLHRRDGVTVARVASSRTDKFEV